MAEKTPDEDPSEPNLELPSLFGRRRRPKSDARTTPEPASREARPVDPQDRLVEPGTRPVDPQDRVVESGTGVVEPGTRVVEPVETSPPPAAPAPPQSATEPDPAPRRRARRTAPALPGGLAATLAGLVTGLAGTALTYGLLRGCDSVRGTGSCGGGAGLGLLLVVVVAMVLLGAGVLAALRVAEARAVSFLGTGLTCVVALLVLIEELFSRWMFLTVPVICAASYALAHWVTTRFVEIPEEGPNVDVR